MSHFIPQDAGFEARVRTSFTRQQVMITLGATMTHVAPGEIEIQLPFRPDLTQQNGFLHAGIITTIVDSACGYAAFSLMPADVGVLTVEYKVNFLAPAQGAFFAARGRVTRPGRTITVCSGEVVAVQEGHELLIATMLATMMAVRDRPNAAE
ncbi:MAG TPA: PaaI family thioesterase [Ktedonobacterales bacterium]|jgi:uncharacterized protein (TIGR00369 family)